MRGFGDAVPTRDFRSQEINLKKYRKFDHSTALYLS